MSADLERARAFLRQGLRESGASREEAAKRAEDSIRRVATKIERGENPAPGENKLERFKRK
jgi:hypothetical protein